VIQSLHTSFSRGKTALRTALHPSASEIAATRY
jgi:hypothetical protein